MPDEWIPPMLAVEAPLPRDLSRYAAEAKWDGQRLQISVGADGRLSAYARSGTDVTTRYPELAPLADTMAATRPAAVDGELIAIDPATGRPSFALLQRRMGLASPGRIRAAQREVPIRFVAFDALVTGGRAVTTLPYLERRALLESLELTAGPARTPPAWVDDPQAGIEWTREQQLEGVILKRIDGPYLPGVRSRLWIKHKHRRAVTAVIGGWLADAHGDVRSLLVGTPAPGGLRYIGAVGSGLSRAERRTLLPLLAEATADVSPFTEGLDHPPRGARWVLPLLQGEVGYAELTSAGLLRHPAWKGLRGVIG